MSAAELLQLLTQVLFALVFTVTAARLARRPTRPNLDTALFFGTAAALVVEGWVVRALDVTPDRWLTAATSALLMALPYLFLRLVDDVAAVPTWLLRGAAVALAVAVVGLFVIPPPLTGPVAALYVVDFVGLQVYAAAVIWRESQRGQGAMRRRLQAVAAGSLALGGVILAAGAQLARPDLAMLWTALAQVASIACGIGYWLGFAPPNWLRRAWQEPELRAFLGRASALPRLPDTATIVRELERGAAAAVGVQHALIGLWDTDAGLLRFPSLPVEYAVAPGDTIGGRAFGRQTAVLSVDAARDDPEHADEYRRGGATAILAAPISAGERRLGVLVVYAARAPVFADDDLHLVQLLADQAAVILESRALIDEAARVQAREVATRLKDDFLSAAAHDLKTPLTTLLAQAQLLERRATRDPAAPADRDGIARIVREAARLRLIVLELLDAARVEPGTLLGRREPVDLTELIREVVDRHARPPHRWTVDLSADPVEAVVDRFRIAQLLDNLLENARKYSPAGGEIVVGLRRLGDVVRLTVADHGIGIPAADLPHVFDRFYRAGNVDDRRHAGMGLGLYICRGIVDEHGGRLEAAPTPGGGTTFTVDLPIRDAAAARREAS